MSERRPRVGVGCVVEKDNKVVLGKRMESHVVGCSGFPGGHLEFGERTETSATRELLEETGLKVVSLQLDPWVENMMKGGLKITSCANTLWGLRLELLEDIVSSDPS